MYLQHRGASSKKMAYETCSSQNVQAHPEVCFSWEKEYTSELFCVCVRGARYRRAAYELLASSHERFQSCSTAALRVQRVYELQHSGLASCSTAAYERFESCSTAALRAAAQRPYQAATATQACRRFESFSTAVVGAAAQRPYELQHSSLRVAAQQPTSHAELQHSSLQATQELQRHQLEPVQQLPRLPPPQTEPRVQRASSSRAPSSSSKAPPREQRSAHRSKTARGPLADPRSLSLVRGLRPTIDRLQGS